MIGVGGTSSCPPQSNYRDGFHEFGLNGREHWVKQTWFFDLQAAYDFTSISGSHARPGWKQILDGMRVSVGCTNLFDHDPPDSVNDYPQVPLRPHRAVYLL